MKKLIVLIGIGLLPGCVTLKYHDQKVKEAFDLGYNIGAPQMKECVERLAIFNQRIQNLQIPQPPLRAEEKKAQ